jgi:GNAT superfamily N-acetyltransferase
MHPRDFFVEDSFLIHLDRSRFDELAELLGDTPFTVTPYFFLRRAACDLYVDGPAQPNRLVVVPHVPGADAYVFVREGLEPAEWEGLADFVAGLSLRGGILVPVELVQPIRARREVTLEVEGLCFTYRRVPTDFRAYRPKFVRRLGPDDLAAARDLPPDAGFMFQNYCSPQVLLSEGLAFGLFRDGRLVSVTASLALTAKHCDVGAYTRPRYRSRGYATDCVEAIFAHCLETGVRPLWRIGIRQKVAIYFAEKLAMDEIGTAGREVYLHVAGGSSS